MPIGVPLPPPYQGQNSQLPMVSVENPFCERMQNFNNKGAISKLRHGNDLFATVATTSQSLDISSYDAATPLLFALTNDGGSLIWYDITSGTPSAVLTLAASSATIAYTLFFNNYLFYFGDGNLSATGGGAGPQYYNGSIWGTAAYTYPASFNPMGGDVYKNRAYLIRQSSAAYGYSPINAISGAITEVDLAQVISSKAELRMIRPISMTQNLTAETVQAFIFSSGEVLVYSGTYPNSADWALIARFKISKPLYQNSFVDAKGDSFIFTETEILSLRNLFVSGYDQERDSGIGSNDQPRWEQIASALLAESIQYEKFVKGVYDEKNDRLVISLPNYVDYEDGAMDLGVIFQYIYDFNLGAWFEYVQEDALLPTTTGACYHKNNVFILAYSTDTYAISIEGSTNYVDDQLDGSGTNPISYLLRSAPAPLSRFGVVVTSGLELIMKTDIYSTVNFKLIADLGVTETNPQVISGGISGSLEKPFVDMGIESNIVQYEISGDSASSTVGLEIHSTNLWVSPSEGLSR